jgi:predicted Zn-dependent protease with MMP-like domain
LAFVRRGEFETIVDEALGELPEWVVEAMENIHVVVEEWPPPDREPEGQMLLGLYEGVNLHDRASGYSGFLPDRITLYMGPHLALRLPPSRLKRQIRKTVLHEVAHHLGIDDERLHELGY